MARRDTSSPTRTLARVKRLLNDPAWGHSGARRGKRRRRGALVRCPRRGVSHSEVVGSGRRETAHSDGGAKEVKWYADLNNERERKGVILHFRNLPRPLGDADMRLAALETPAGNLAPILPLARELIRLGVRLRTKEEPAAPICGSRDAVRLDLNPSREAKHVCPSHGLVTLWAVALSTFASSSLPHHRRWPPHIACSMWPLNGRLYEAETSPRATRQGPFASPLLAMLQRT